ncbi:hypothetical protein Q3G72_005517 [Acer saccharum]|nr:hypothetical protein Q3G72_005517 [Acer saccharum]
METPFDDDSSITITDYSKSQRIVHLIDLNPLLHLRDPNPYLKALSAAVKTLISLPPLASSLFSIKPFFSSLSPLLSSPHQSSHAVFIAVFVPGCQCRGVDAAAGSRLHVGPGDLRLRGGGDGGDYDPGNVLAFLRSNLVVLFSPIVKSFDFKCGFLDVDVNVDDECVRDEGLLNDRFHGLFESVNDAFIRNDIHFSWVDVNCEFESSDGNQIEVKSGFFESGIRGLGWGFCSSDSIVLGSVLVNFGLIYPRIGILSHKDLEVLAKDMGEFGYCKVAPIRQIFLSFLYREDDESFAHSVLHELGGVNLAPFVMKRDKEICKSDMIAHTMGKLKAKRIKGVYVCSRA